MCNNFTRQLKSASTSRICLLWTERSLKLNCRPFTMPIVSGCAKLCLVAFHLGHTLYGGSKVPCSFCHRTPFGGPFFQALRGTSWPGLAGSFVFRWLGVRSQEPQQELRFDTKLGDEFFTSQFEPFFLWFSLTWDPMGSKVSQHYFFEFLGFATKF